MKFLLLVVVQLFSGKNCLQPACCGGAAKRIPRSRSVARTVSVRRCISGQAMELTNRGALSILDASFKSARSCFLVSKQPWLTVRMEQRAFGGILCLLRSDWSLRWIDVCICTDVGNGFAFAVREGCLELASEVGRVSERTRLSLQRLLRNA